GPPAFRIAFDFASISIDSPAMNPQAALAVVLRLVLILASLNLASELNAAEPRTATSSGRLLVANKGDHTLSIVDPVAGRVIAATAEDGITGHEVAASPDGRRAFVPIYGNAGVGRPGTDGSLLRVIDLEKHELSGTVDFGRGVRPHCAVIGPKNGLLYVTTEIENSVTIIDPRALKIVGTIPTGQPESHMLAISRDGRRGYTANVGPGTVSVLDLEAKKLLTVIPISRSTQRIALSVDDRWAFTADQTHPQLAVIDTATNGIRSWIALPGTAYGTAPTPDGRWLIVALDRINQIGVIDLSRMKLVRTLDVPRSPQEVLIQPDGAKAYVSCSASRQVAMIDLKNWTVEKLITTGAGADGLAWAAKAD
ncbi:MAG: YncE family protein, partial [Verrucomicrobiota bacterium]